MQLPFVSARDPWDPTLGFIGLILGPPVVYFGCSWALSNFCTAAAGGLLPGVVPVSGDPYEALLRTLASYIFFAGAIVWAICTPLTILLTLFGANERRAVRIRELIELNAIGACLMPLIVAVPEAIDFISTGGGAI